MRRDGCDRMTKMFSLFYVNINTILMVIFISWKKVYSTNPFTLHNFISFSFICRVYNSLSVWDWNIEKFIALISHISTWLKQKKFLFRQMNEREIKIYLTTLLMNRIPNNLSSIFRVEEILIRLLINILWGIWSFSLLVREITFSFINKKNSSRSFRSASFPSKSKLSLNSDCVYIIRCYTE